MKTLRLLSLCLIGSALTLSACTKDDTSSDTGLTVATTNDPSETGDNTDFAGDGDGDGDATTTTTTGDGDPTTTGVFVPDDDVPGASSCDVWAQDCPEDEKCVAYASTGGNWDANKCVPVMGDGQPGDPCMYNGAVESTDDCAADSWCWDVNVDNIGTCTPFCGGTPDNPICDPGAACSIANNGSITLCLLACDPLLQDCPADGTSCFWAGTDFVCANATQDIPTGEPCGFINDCVAGNLCADAANLPNCNGSACCASFCSVSDPTCTVAGTECTAFFEEGMAPPGYEDIGLCIIPGA
jgi:hypothetical protein